MDLAETLLFVSVLGSVGAVVWTVAQRVMPDEGKRISERLSDHSGRGARRAEGNRDRDAGPLRRLAQWAARPFMGNQAADVAAATDAGSRRVGGLRARLAMAGIYDPAAIRAVAGYKFIGLTLGVLVGHLVGGHADAHVTGAAFGGLIGYMAPQLWLRARVGANQLALNHGLPDAMDLMVICVESGLTVDGTMQRVGEELEMAHPAISREFGICHTETRLGVARQQAFKNLATRTGNLNLQALTAMLVQADRFGTSVAAALRVQAESMRSKRQFAAEEMAAKASVKMSFPLVLFIFPATFFVMMGPMAVQFFNDTTL